MSTNEYTQNEELQLVDEAIHSKDQNRLKKLSNSVYINVRKAVARNKNVDTKVINTMAQRENASQILYWLFQHPNCSMRRRLPDEDLQHKCVTCALSELQLHKSCMSCPN